MIDKILIHPALNNAQDLHDICRPLQQLNITYFAHVHVDNNGYFSALTNNPGFTEHYLNNEYYNADIHMANNDKLGNYVVWDAIERFGKSEKMHREAAEFGVQHTFTIIEKSSQGKNFYHFANNSSCKTINQIYLCHLDLLKIFIMHFNESVTQSKSLSHAYNISFALDKAAGNYSAKLNDEFFIDEIKRLEFMGSISLNKLDIATKTFLNLNQWQHAKLSKRELQCLYYYAQGKIAKEIAKQLSLSKRTVEHYLATAKNKVGIVSKSELLQKNFG